MKALSEIFAENLRFYRKKSGLTQKELSAKLGYTEKAVSKWESGVTIPPAESLVKLAETLQTNIDTLLSFQKEPEYYLGIDGGATKTMFALANAKGEVIRHLCLGSSNPVDIGFEKTEALLTEGIREVCKNIPCSEISLYAGISGGTEGCNEEILSEFFRRFRFASVGVGNDAINIVSAGLGTEDGIAVIIGTGCIAFSQVNGELRQYGGFGYLFDVAGDGYNIGRDAIHAALYDERGGGKHTVITKLISDIVGSSTTRMLTDFYEKGKRYIASFAKVVFEAYDRGDAVAKEILYRNMGHIALLLDTALEDFSADGRPVKAVFVGGLTRRADVLFGMIRDQVKNKNAFKLAVYPHEPVLGALKRAGAPVNTLSDNGISR